MAEAPHGSPGSAAGSDMSRSSSYDKELAALDLHPSPASPSSSLTPAEQSSSLSDSLVESSPDLATMMGAIREELPTDVCDQIQSVIDQVTRRRARSQTTQP